MKTTGIVSFIIHISYTGDSYNVISERVNTYCKKCTASQYKDISMNRDSMVKLSYIVAPSVSMTRKYDKVLSRYNMSAGVSISCISRDVYRKHQYLQDLRYKHNAIVKIYVYRFVGHGQPVISLFKCHDEGQYDLGTYKLHILEYDVIYIPVIHDMFDEAYVMNN